MSKSHALKERLPCYYKSAIAAGIAFLLSMQTVLATGGGGGANTIWTQFSNVMRDIYTQLLGISTILAVTAAAIALIVRMVSRNQRAVDEATSWLKRIVITWIILNTMGFFIAYIQPWIAGGQYTP
jgi:putative copper export protein